MQKRAGLLTIFSLFLLLSLVVFFVFRQQTLPFSLHIIETVTLPLQKSLSSAFGGTVGRFGKTEQLQNQNRELAKKIVDQRELTKEAKALRDQYDAEVMPSQQLLPAKVIGMKTFIPGISLSEEIILDRGSNQGVKVGQTVVLTNTIVGNISQVSSNRSVVSLLSNKKQSITARASKTDALGIIRGKGNGVLVFENVVLSETLEKGDIVVTKGDQDSNGLGFPPDLVIGKITSVDKRASDLFQSAEIESLIDISRLSTVFIIRDN